MRVPRGTVGALAVLVLVCSAARADDVHKADLPDPGFLEFLGSVDRLADVNPDYLAQAEARAKFAAGPPPATAPPRPAPPPNASSVPGGHDND
jgi:hypothetical protein